MIQQQTCTNNKNEKGRVRLLRQPLVTTELADYSTIFRSPCFIPFFTMVQKL